MILEKGFTELNYCVQEFNFKEIMFLEINRFFRDNNKPEIDCLENIHKSQLVVEDTESVRQLYFSLFRSDEFQTLYRGLCSKLIDTYFDGEGLFQNTPTIRIQLPGRLSVSYHTDAWYGHGQNARSFWLPLTELNEKNTLMMSVDINQSLKLIQDISEKLYPLDKINDESRLICSPLLGSFGDLYSFSSEMIHGTELNSSSTTRVSFDFRIIPDSSSLGTKPLSNFLDRKSLGSNLKENPEKEVRKKLNAISYSNLCNGISAKAQLMLCYAYASSQSIEIVGNESEILIFEHLPVLEYYLKNSTADYDSVIVFGTEIFHSDKAIAEKMLEIAKDSNRTMIFCAQGIIFSPKDNVVDFLNKMNLNIN